MCIAMEAPIKAWVDVCALEEIVPGTAVCALVEGRQVAVARLSDAPLLYAIDNFDPFARAFVLSRGIIGDHEGAPTLASPIYKQAFDLRTGRCVDEPTVQLRTFQVRVQDGRVEIALPR